jgi:hypothetical protein
MSLNEAYEDEEELGELCLDLDADIDKDIEEN